MRDIAKNKADLLEVNLLVAEQVGEFHCRLCGEDHPHPYDVKSPMYGSPVVVCPHCKGEQLVLGRLEPALYAKFRVISNYKAYIFSALISFVLSVTLILSCVFAPVSDDTRVVIFSSASSVMVFFMTMLLMLKDVWKAERKKGVVTI